MKNLLQIFLVIFALGFIGACSKDDNDPDGSSLNTHRVSQVTMNSGEGDVVRYVFSYQGDKLVQVMLYEKDDNENWIEQHKDVITYTGDKATLICHQKEAGVWQMTSKYEYVIQNGLMTQELYFTLIDDAWINLSKWTYHYSNKRLTSWQSEHYDAESGATLDLDKGENVYQNGKITEYKEYDSSDESEEWIQDDKILFSYSGDQLTGYMEYELDETENWEEYKKAELSYVGNLISQRVTYYWDSELSEWEEGNSIFYTYNSNGYLLTETDDEDRQYLYEYEEGNGNATFFWVYPEEVMYRTPTLKSASVKGNGMHIPYYQRLKMEFSFGIALNIPNQL